MATSRPPMICSICDASLDMETSGKRLYGYNVCGTCHSSFAMKRAFAYILDTVLFCIVAVPLTFFILLLSGIMAVLVFFACLFGLLFLFIAKDGFAGHSPAKAILGLQVIDDLSGRPC